MSSEKGRDKVFLRTASGLVRSASTLDVLLLNMTEISIGEAIAVLFLFLLITVPGAYPPVAFALWSAVLIIPTLCWALMSIIFPRSGGDYVYNTRILTPSLGFVVNFQFVFWAIFFVGWVAYYWVLSGLAVFVTAIGILFNQPSWLDAAPFFSSQNGIFIVGSLLILALGGLAVIPLKYFFKFQKITVSIAMVGLIAAGVVLATTTQQHFIAAFNSAVAPVTGSADYYHEVIVQAQAAGGTWPGYSLGPMFWAFTVIAMANAITWFSAYIGSEIKRVERSQLIGMVGAISLVGVITAVFTYLLINVAGIDFLYSMAYLGYVAGGLKLPTETAFYHFLASVVVGNPILIVLILISFVIWAWGYIMPILIPMPRTILAWSLDRLIPAKIGEVNDRWTTPHWATLICVLGSIGFLAIYDYTPWLTFGSGLFGLMMATLFVSISATILPWRMPKTYEASPLKKYEFKGIPALSVVGVCSFIITLILEIQYLVYTPNGANDPHSLSIMAIAVIAGIIVYVVAVLVRKREGIDIGSAYREVPPA
jgi:amino acid transporter